MKLFEIDAKIWSTMLNGSHNKMIIIMKNPFAQQFIKSQLEELLWVKNLQKNCCSYLSLVDDNNKSDSIRMESS